VNDKKGITLIEIIITLALMGIIITPIFSFFLMNYKTFNTETNNIDLSFEIEEVANTISNNSITYKNIHNVIGNKFNDEIEISKVEFLKLNNNKDIYEIKENKLFLNDKEIGKFIEKISLIPIPKDLRIGEILNAKGFILRIKLYNNGMKNEKTIQVNLRNNY